MQVSWFNSLLAMNCPNLEPGFVGCWKKKSRISPKVTITTSERPCEIVALVFAKCVLGKTVGWNSVGEHLRSGIAVLIQPQPT